MRENSKVVFASELKQVKALLKDKTKPRRVYDEAMYQLVERIGMYEVAEDFMYSQTILDRIKNARNNIEAENILISARRAS